MMTRSLCLLFVCIFGVGCAETNLQSPTAAVTGMAIKGIDKDGFTMDFDVDVTNPNATALPMTAADYTIGLGGVNVAEGKAKPEGAIPAGGTRSVKLPVTLTYENLMAAKEAIVKSGGNVPYALRGAVVFNTGVPLLGDRRVPLRYEGTLAFKDIVNNPRVLLQSPMARALAKALMEEVLGR